MTNQYAINIEWMTGTWDPRSMGLPSEMEIPGTLTTQTEIAHYLRDATGWPAKNFFIDPDRGRDHEDSAETTFIQERARWFSLYRTYIDGDEDRIERAFISNGIFGVDALRKENDRFEEEVRSRGLEPLNDEPELE
jgi:hypothetical protein